MGNLNNVLIGGSPLEINNLHTSLFNWGGITEEPHDLGNPEVFLFFNINIEKYIKYRSIAFANSWQDRWNKTRNGKLIWKLSQNRAQRELNNIKEEQFIFGRDFEFLQEENLTNQ